jgi:hypothetical protein
MSETTEDLLQSLRDRIHSLEVRVTTLENDDAHIKLDKVQRELADVRTVSAAHDAEINKIRAQMNQVMLDLLDTFILKPTSRSQLHIHNSCSSSLAAWQA